MPEFPCEGPISALIQTNSGSVRLTAEARDTVSVEVAPEHNNESSQALAEATRVTMSGNTLSIEVPNSMKGFGFIRRNQSLRITVRMPLDSTVDVGSASADTIMTGRFGDSHVASASGDLRADEIAGELQRNSASGDSEIGSVAGNFKIDTASGDLRVRTVGGDLHLRSASGDVTVESVGRDVTANTASGDIRINSICKGETSINSASGDVVVGVAEGTGVWLDISTLSGDTTSELAMPEAPADNTPSLRLKIHTLSGDVLIRRAAPVASGVQDD
jgi:DUF4097 and DUF4098 domain-containing protein YvlB